MQRTELFEFIRDTLSNAGYYVSDAYFIRSIGFDLIARRDNSLLIIKVLTNINAFPEQIAEELKKLAFLLGGHPLLIGLRTGAGILETGVVYDRFGIQAINPATLHGHLLEGIPLKVYAAPGGFYTNINTSKLVALRKQQNLSRGNFARSIHVSRRMVRMYEEGMNARVDVAFRIEKSLGDSLIQPIDITHNKQEVPTDNKHSKEQLQTEYLQPLQHEIFSLLHELGYTIITLGKCPFEAVSKEREKILLTCVQHYDSKIKQKAKVVSNISKITEKQAVFFTDKKGIKNNIEGTPLIIREELRKLKDPEEIIELIIERECEQTS
jgi:putative transcriptional regulator